MIIFVGIAIQIALQDNASKGVMITIITTNAQIVNRIVLPQNFFKGILKMVESVFMQLIVGLINVIIVF